MIRIRLALAAALLAPVAAHAAETPVARAAAYDDAVVAVMKQALPLAARTERFRALVAQHYDMPAIAALVTGPAWTSASAADRAAMVAALTRHSALALARNFDRYKGERFTVDPGVQTRGDSAIVKVTIASGSGRDILYYRIKSGKIVDVISGGVSQLAVQRADLAATAASGGVAAVVKRLDEVDAKAGR